jgi:hypothetical protein
MLEVVDVNSYCDSQSLRQVSSRLKDVLKPKDYGSGFLEYVE